MAATKWPSTESQNLGLNICVVYGSQKKFVEKWESINSINPNYGYGAIHENVPKLFFFEQFWNIFMNCFITVTRIKQPLKSLRGEPIFIMCNVQPLCSLI